MKPTRSVFRPLLLVAGLVSWGLPVQSAPPRADAAPVRAVPAAAEPVQQLIIRYRVGEAQGDRAAAASASDERAGAAERVSRSAERAQAWGMHYLKSVSPQLHVARLSRALPADEARALIERLQADPAVASVTIDQRVRPHALPLPTDPFFTTASSGYYQWHLQAPSVVPGGINAPAAWASSTGANVTVAVLDGGYRPHPDLAANLLTASDYDFISDLWTANDGDLRDADAQDPGDWISSEDASLCPGEDLLKSSWHGTHVTGLVGALANGSEGVGVAPDVKVLPVRVLGRCGGYLSDILAGMRWAAGLSVSGVTNTSTPARALNLSLGVEGACDAATQEVINEVRARGVSIVASTGNDGLTVITKPASCMGVVAVTAHDRLGVLASYANVGSGTAISAPGGELDGAVASTWNLGKTVPGADSYGLMYGTSMAVPQVVGVLALMASVRPDLPMSEVEKVLLSTARPFLADTYCSRNPGQCGAGMLDAGAAVAAVQTYVPAAEADGGGGCTVAPGGQADAGLPLLALVAAISLFWRRRRAMP